MLSEHIWKIELLEGCIALLVKAEGIDWKRGCDTYQMMLRQHLFVSAQTARYPPSLQMRGGRRGCWVQIQAAAPTPTANPFSGIFRWSRHCVRLAWDSTFHPSPRRVLLDHRGAGDWATEHKSPQVSLQQAFTGVGRTVSVHVAVSMLIADRVWKATSKMTALLTRFLHWLQYFSTGGDSDIPGMKSPSLSISYSKPGTS